MSCDGCPLKGRPKIKSWGSGDIMIVGEAPGYDEARAGEPFIGRSGKLLRHALDQLGVKEYVLTNAVKCHPPKNELPTQAIYHCANNLLDDIEKYKPKLIVAVGNSAVKSLTRTNKGITKLRGQIFYFGEIPVLPTYHPAAVLRNKRLGDDFVADLEMITSIGKLPTIPKPKIQVMKKEVEAAAFLNSLKGKATIDIETDGLDFIENTIKCVGVSPVQGYSVIIPGYLLDKKIVANAMRRAISSDAVSWIAHNAKFDLGFLATKLGVFGKAYADTMLMHFTMDVGGHGLKRLTTKFFDIPDWSHDPEDLVKIDGDELYVYNGMDTDATFYLYNKLDSMMTKEERWLHRHILVPLSNVLQKAEVYGVKIDQDRLRQLDVTTKARVDSLRRTMREIVGDNDFNPNSTKQTPRVLFDQIGLPEIEGRSTKESVLLALRGLHPIVDVLLEYRKHSKMYSTYINGLWPHIKNDGRIHTNFMIHGTLSGRLSSREPNMQNMPRTKEMRDIFIPEDGHVFVDADYSQLEFRTFAWYTRDPFLLEVYQKGLDLHSQVAANMFGAEFTKEQRVAAKSVNFGLIYGQSPSGLATNTKIPGMSTDQATAFVTDFFNRMPRSVQWIKGVHAKMLSEGEVITPFGRRRRFPFITQENVAQCKREAVNHMCQSLAADITFLSMIELANRIKERIILTVHDSILIECREENAEEVAKQTKQIMEEHPLLFLEPAVPFTADVTIKRRWGDDSDWSGSG